MKVLLKNCALIVTSLLILCACTITSPSENSNGGAIDAALRDSIHINRMAKNKKSQDAMPSSVRNALLPKINLPSATGVANQDQNEQHFDIAVNNIPAKDFFTGLVSGTKFNITVSPQVTGNISLELKNVTIPQTLEAVRDTYGYEYNPTSYGYEILPKHLETRIFTLDYLAMDRSGKSTTTVSSGQITDVIGAGGQTTSTTTVQSGSIETSTKANLWDLLKANLETIIGKEEGRSVVLNPQSGTVLVKAYPEELRSIAKYLDSIQNIMEREVIIEAKIIEVELAAEFHSGIQWNVLGASQVPTITSIEAQQAPATSLFTFHASNAGAFNTVITLLNNQGKVNVLSSPRISTINNQKAIIKIGNDRFFVTNVQSNTTAISGGGITSQNITLTPFFSGISLDVTPQIKENGEVTLHIHPIISKVTMDKQDFTVNNQEQNLPLAASSIRESDSVVTAQNGQVIILGGLMENVSYEYQTGTPGVDRLPDIGGLFKSHNNSADKFELVILLRPIVVGGTKTWQQRLQEATDVIKSTKCDFKYEIDKKPENEVPTPRCNIKPVTQPTPSNRCNPVPDCTTKPVPIKRIKRCT